MMPYVYIVYATWISMQTLCLSQNIRLPLLFGTMCLYVEYPSSCAHIHMACICRVNSQWHTGLPKLPTDSSVFANINRFSYLSCHLCASTNLCKKYNI